MNRFAELLDRLVLTPARNGKLTLLVDYFRSVEDPDRGLALSAITGDLSIAAVKPAMLRALVTERMDPVLFGYSYDYVGDLAETVSLVWPDPPPHLRPNRSPSLGEVVGALQAASRSDGPTVLARLLDSASIEARFAMIKLVTGGLRIGVSARLAKQALADFGKVEVAEIEELWHGLKPPYVELFAWLEGKAPKPEKAASALFRPVMLSNPVEDRDLERLDPADYAAEWKWDGIRVQAVSEAGIRRLYSRTGDDVSGAFPDLVDAMDFSAALDGELLVGDPAAATGTLLRPATAIEPQVGLAQGARSVSGLHALLRPACSLAAKTSGRCPSRSGAGISNPSSRRSIPPASTCRRWRPSTVGQRSTRCAGTRRIR